MKLDGEKLQPIGKQQSCALDCSLEADRLKVSHNISEKRWGQLFNL